MNLKIISRIAFHLSLAMIFVVLSGCRNSHTQVAEADQAPKPQSPVEVKLSLQGTPSVGEIVRLTLEVKPLIEAPLIRIAFILPEGLEAISGEPSWAGTLAQGEMKTVEITARLTIEKQYIVQGMATLEQQPGRTYTAVDSLTINLQRQGGTVVGVDQVQAKSTPAVKKSRDNRDLIEFKGED